MLASKNLDRYYLWIILGLGLIFYIPFLGGVHLFDWDEINFAESSREMLVSGDYFRVTVNYKPFWEKPPLFFWLQVISMKIFGVNEFAARFPNAMTGVLTLGTLFVVGKRTVGARFGFVWALVYLGSFLPFFYFKSGIIDPLFNYFIFLSILLLISAINAEGKRKNLQFMFLSGIVCGLGVLTKGPVAFLLVVITFLAYLVVSRFKVKLNLWSFLIFPTGVILSSCIWYLPELLNNGLWFFEMFLRYQVELFLQPVAGHQQPLYYHFVVVFVGCFPMSIIALPAFARNQGEDDSQNHRRWMIILFAVVMILFTIVKTKIIHYSSMSYLPLSFLAATVLYKSWAGAKRLNGGVVIGVTLMGLVFASLMILLPYFFYHKEKFIHHLKDPFAQASIMQNVAWSGWEFIWGLVFIVTVGVVAILYWKGKTVQALLVHSVVSAFVLTACLKEIAPKIEKYIQGPAISFYESTQDQDVYMTTVGFHSYAHLFYFKQPRYENHEIQTSHEWLIHGNIDKPAFFVTKITNNYFEDFEDIVVVAQVGGFKFYLRAPEEL